MQTVDIHDAQADLSRLIEQARQGEPFLIARDGEALVKVEAVEAADSPQAEPIDVSRRFGFMKGQFNVPDDFDTMMQDEIIEMFEGRPDKFADVEEYLREKQAGQGEAKIP